jgi:pimeloyl-ACP methyl ester carboxylesterase
MAVITQDEYVKVRDINTRFRVEGDAGTAVIMVHGLGGSLENWAANTGALATKHRVYTMDLPGFGRSDKQPRLKSMHELVEFLVDFMEIQHIDRAGIIGHSMGGGLALQLAIQYPQKVEKIVLVDNAGMGREVIFDFKLCSIPLVGELITRPSRKGTVGLWKKIVCEPGVITDELVESTYRLATQPGAMKALLATIRAGINIRGQRADLTRPLMKRLAGITAPTMVIWGKDDRIIPLAHARIAVSKIPNATLHIFDRCGHMPQLEYPEDFNKMTLDFLAE